MKTSNEPTLRTATPSERACLLALVPVLCEDPSRASAPVWIALDTEHVTGVALHPCRPDSAELHLTTDGRVLLVTAERYHVVN